MFFKEASVAVLVAALDDGIKPVCLRVWASRRGLNFLFTILGNEAGFDPRKKFFFKGFHDPILRHIQI